MAGLLDFLNTPEAQLGIGLLAYSGDMGRPMGFGERIAGAIGSTQKQQQAAEEKRLRAGLLEAQMGELQSKSAQRDRVQGLLGNVFGAPSTNMGAGSNVAPAAPMGGGGQGAEQAGTRSLRGVPLEQIAALKAAGGPDLIEAWKVANVPTSMAAGSYAMLPGQAPQYMADPSKGMGIGPQGVYALPGAIETQAAMAGATETATQRARAGFDLVNIKGPQGETIAVPRAQVLGNAAPRQPSPSGNFTGAGYAGGSAAAAATDQRFIMERELQGAQQRLQQAQGSGNAQAAALAAQDVAGLQRELQRLPGGGSPTAQAAPALAGNVVELSPAQIAQNDAVKAGMVARATDTAKADVVRDTDTQKKAKSANSMIAAADRALELLQQGPTASGFGEMVDKGAAFVGRSTPGAQVAAQLDIVAGDLVNNVPRMEGPQSDGDRLEYRTQAGRAADRNLPVAQRAAAMQEVKRLQSKYAPLNGGDAPAAPTAQPSFQDRGYQNADAAIRDAQNAIMRGADRAKVAARLQEMGLSLPSGAQGAR